MIRRLLKEPLQMTGLSASAVSGGSGGGEPARGPTPESNSEPTPDPTPDPTPEPTRDHAGRFFSHVPDLMSVVSPDGRFHTLNEAWSSLGYNPDELVSRPIPEFLHPDDVESTMQEFRLRKSGQERGTFINRLRAADGSYRWIEWKSMPAEDGLQYAIGRDVTGYLDNENRLRKQVERNRILMRELHHRTKNNLAAVSSLLALAAESQYEGDPSGGSPRAILREARNRVQVVSSVYELMQHTEEARSVEMDEYIGMLADSVFRTFNNRGDALRLEAVVENVRICSKIAVPIGLILNELLVNVLKHARWEGTEGTEGTMGTVRILFRTVTVDTRRTGTLQVVDDGMTTHLEEDETRPSGNGDASSGVTWGTNGDNGGIGMMLVRSLVEQVQGELVVERAGGTGVTLRFPCTAVAD